MLNKFMHKKGFTLAEVMLTMTIVGVVAAMTIPTLHYSRMKKEYSAKLKNFYSKMNNAILDMELDKGSFRDMKLPNDSAAGFTWYMENIDPYMGHEMVDSTNNVVYFRDGSALRAFYKGDCLDVDYDVNGDKGSCNQGIDCYHFLFCFAKDKRENWFGSDETFFGVYGSGLNDAGVTRGDMVKRCASEDEGKTDSEGNTIASTKAWCTRLLQNDQWEFKADYPHKF